MGLSPLPLSCSKLQLIKDAHEVEDVGVRKVLRGVVDRLRGEEKI
jgi:hypothetical protein